MSRLATTAAEHPVWIPVGDEGVFGILTEPTGPPNGLAVVVTSSGHWVTTIGTNRTYVRLARRLAADGYHVLRYDYLGVGESSGPSRAYRLDRPFVDDTSAVLDWLRDRGLRRFVLLGNCYGARVAMAAAQAQPGDVAGVALYPPAVRDFGHGQRAASLPLREAVRRALARGGVRTVVAKLRNPAARARYRAALAKKARARRNGHGPAADGFEWVSPNFVRPLGQLTEAGVPVLLVFGKEEDFHLDFQRGRAGPLGRVLDRAGDLVTVTIEEGNAHGLGTLAVQDEVIAAIERWIAARLVR